MEIRHLIVLFVFMGIWVEKGDAQTKQRIRGTVTDVQVKTPLAGATVVLNNGLRTTVTGSDGSFSFPELSIGTYTITVSYTGYAERTWENLALSSGKELVLNLDIEPSVQSQNEVVITAKSKRNRPINEMSLVSARAFTVEETQRYAAAVNDPLRMATAFPGVMAAFDGSNDIVIRGNSPSGLIWRMEGVDIPNPNHFSTAGSSGGGISILSSQLLSNSDFITGAFAAEYGNGTSGVFDLHLRKGNNEKREYSVQAGVLGLNLAAEGPIKTGYKGSYLVNYRYSTLQLLDKMGVDVGVGATDFQDFSFNVHLPTAKMGTFSFFGFGGLSSQKLDEEKDQSKWEEEWDRYRARFHANTGVAGLKHVIHVGSNTLLQHTLAYSHTDNGSDFKYREDDGLLNPYHADQYTNRKISFSSTVQHRMSAQSLLKAGITSEFRSFDFLQENRENKDQPYREVINATGNTNLYRAFAQWQFRFDDRLTLTSGVHGMFLALNNSGVAEPRAALQYKVGSRSTIGLGYGLHSQVQPLGVYFVEGNKELDFTKSHHLVASFQQTLSNNWKWKAEAYYQQLTDVPVSIYDTSSFSMINVQGDYVDEPVVNKGKGRNYGLELSLERYLYNGFYGMATVSLYDSKYTAANGKEYNTRFNGNYISTFIAGKEFEKQNRKKVWGLNTKVICGGGFMNTPINEEASKNAGYAIYDETRAFSVQNDPYFRIDLRVSLQWNYAKRSATLSLDLQNLTNRQNVDTQVFDRHTGKLETTYQAGMIPVLNYKIEF